jgi:hypothetical protein
MSATSCGVVTTTAPVSRLLRQRELRVAGAGREVDDEEVERAPLHIGEELVDRFHDHRPAPDHRRVGIGDEAEGHGLDAVTLHRHDLLVALVDLRATLDAEHHLLRRAVDVGVEQADAVAERAQREGEVRGDGRLADAAFPRCHGDAVLHVGEDVWAGRHRSADGRSLLRADLEVELHIRHAFERAHRRFGVARDLLADARVLGLEVDREEDSAAVDAHVAHEAERHDVARESGEADLLQRLKDQVIVWALGYRGWHSCSPVAAIVHTTRG